MYVADLPGGGREKVVALVPLHRHQLGQRRGQGVDGVFGEMGVGDVALDAFDDQFAAERATPPVFNHVTRALHRGGFTNDAVVQHLAAFLQGLADDHRAVVGRAFLVAGKQQGDGELGVGVGGQQFFHRHHKGGDRGLHVTRAAPIQTAIAVGGSERVAVPLVERARGHHIGVTDKNEGLRRSYSRAYCVGNYSARLNI